MRGIGGKSGRICHIVAGNSADKVGMTLVEILVALALLSIVFGLVILPFTKSFDLLRRARIAGSLESAIMLAMRQIEADLSRARIVFLMKSPYDLQDGEIGDDDSFGRIDIVISDSESALKFGTPLVPQGKIVTYYGRFLDPTKRYSMDPKSTNPRVLYRVEHIPNDFDGDGRYSEDPIEGIDNDGDGRINEDPIDGIDNDGDRKIDEDPIEGIDSDGDGRIDEDPIDGIDNDGDRKIDEDPIGGIDNDKDKRIDEDPFNAPENAITPLDGTDLAGLRFWYLGVDNDGDGKVDEDPIDGIDNDRDGEVDEDPDEASKMIIVDIKLQKVDPTVRVRGERKLLLIRRQIRIRLDPWVEVFYQ